MSTLVDHALQGKVCRLFSHSNTHAAHGGLQGCHHHSVQSPGTLVTPAATQDLLHPKGVSH